METQIKCWLWPDRRIGKRESAELRDEHNALVDSHAELAEVCEAIAKLNEGQGRMNMCQIAGWARAALAKLA